MPSPLPDVARQQDPCYRPLDQVGMSGLALPLHLDGALVLAKADVSVNLGQAGTKGIHMSRLHLALEALSEQLLYGVKPLRHCLDQCVNSQQGSADSARLRLAFDYPLRRPSLVSGHRGWKAYPIALEAELAKGRFRAWLQLTLPYSSTCPCSAALARQLVAADFAQQFPGSLDKEAVLAWLQSPEGVAATPHSQRSEAQITVSLGDTLPIAPLIDLLESALKTPVQTLVKREDEQAFARLNGRHPLFVEDAARTLAQTLEQSPFGGDFRVRVVHKESLHAHDAVAEISQGLPDG